jgi:RNA polymerase sigma factor (sigma-70 family)
LTLTNQDISTILILCKKGNQLAQLEVYNRYSKAMYNVAFRIVKESALAEDCMQEGFIAAFDKLDTFKAEAAFGAWLKRIVVNKSISSYHKSKKYIAISETTEALLAAETDEEGIGEEDFTKLKATQVVKCMQDLHVSYRQILTLHFIEGYDYEEVCEIMKINNANCRTLISRAKESLRKKMTVLQ